MHDLYVFTKDKIKVIDEQGGETFREPLKNIDKILDYENLIECIDKDIARDREDLQRYEEQIKFKNLFFQDLPGSILVSVLISLFISKSIITYLIAFLSAFISFRLSCVALEKSSLKTTIKSIQEFIDFRERKKQAALEEIKKLVSDNEVAYFIPDLEIPVKNTETMNYCDEGIHFCNGKIKDLRSRVEVLEEKIKPKTKVRKR